MSKGLIIAIGLDEYVAEYAIRQISPQHVAFLATEATLSIVHNLSVRLGLSSTKVCFVKDIFSTRETVQECFNAFRWMKEIRDIEELVVDATNCITVVEMATYLSASLLDLYRDILDFAPRISMVYIHSRYAPNAHGVHSEVIGSEQVVALERPVDSLGFVLFIEAIRSFNSNRFEQAGHSFRSLHRDTSSEQSLLYLAFALLAQGYECWDKMIFREAADFLDQACRMFQKLSSFRFAEEIVPALELNRLALRNIIEGQREAIIIDLYSNALRRRQDGRFDDALARLYACLERIIQEQLRSFGIETAKPDYSLLQPEICERFRKALGGELPVELELKRAALLLSYLPDPVGEELLRFGFKSFTGLIGIRNQSILAHGLTPIGAEQFERFHDKLFQPVLKRFLAVRQLTDEELHPYTYLTITSVDEILYRRLTDLRTIVAFPEWESLH